LRISKGESIPETRDQALALLRAVDGDPDRLTLRQKDAIRRLYALDDYGTVAESLERGTVTE